MRGDISQVPLRTVLKGVFLWGNREKERTKRETSKGSLSKGQTYHPETGPKTPQDKSWEASQIVLGFSLSGRKRGQPTLFIHCLKAWQWSMTCPLTL